WVVHSVLWIRTEGVFATMASGSLATLVLIFYGGRRLVTGRWPTPVLPGGALAVVFASPLNQITNKLQAASPGYLSVGAGFLLFALGTWLALSKPKWKKAGVGP